MGWCNVRRFISIVMLKFLVTLGTWQCLWHSRVTLACGDCEIAVEPIASHSDAFHLLRAKGRGWVLLVFAHHLSLQHTVFHMQLCHTQLFTYNLFYFSILHHLLCLSFLPRPRYNIWCSLLEEVALWGYPVLSFFTQRIMAVPGAVQFPVREKMRKQRAVTYWLMLPFANSKDTLVIFGQFFRLTSV